MFKSGLFLIGTTYARMASRSATTARLNLSGLIAAIPTPFNENQEICYKSLKANLELYEKTPLTGYLVSGTNGEAPALSPKERVEVAKFVRENTSRSKVVIAGATAECTKNACDLAVDMGNAGVDGVLVMPPFYFKRFMSDSALIDHYTTVANKSSLPVVIYNNPGVTGIDIGIPVIAELAKHPKIVGVKDIDIKKCAVILSETKGCDFDVVIAVAAYILPALMMGCVGGMTGLSAVLAKETCEIYDLFKKDKIADANALQLKITQPDHKIVGEMGVRGLKGAMELKGFSAGLCRKPIPPLSDAEKEKIKNILISSGYL